ncbi:MAG: hypothetical protein ABI688_11585, partial [Bacteroidota bacterium]
VVKCQTAEEVYIQLERKEPVSIVLTGSEYNLTKPFLISKGVLFAGNKKKPITIRSESMMAIFLIAGNGNLDLQNLTIKGENIRATHFISSDSTGSSNHYNLNMRNCWISELDRDNGCSTIFYAYKYMVADSIIIQKNYFGYNNTNGIIMDGEKDDKGYYNAEKIDISNNEFNSLSGVLLNIYRGGNDESTMGPQLTFSHNRVKDCKDNTGKPLFSFTGVQVTKILSNSFGDCNRGLTLILYKDTVRARHYFEKNSLFNSGTLIKDQFVTEKDNLIITEKENSPN